MFNLVKEALAGLVVVLLLTLTTWLSFAVTDVLLPLLLVDYRLSLRMSYPFFCIRERALLARSMKDCSFVMRD